MLGLPRKEAEVVPEVIPRLLARDVLAIHDRLLLDDGRMLLVINSRALV
jgi:hypothetical protein